MDFVLFGSATGMDASSALIEQRRFCVVGKVNGDQGMTTDDYLVLVLTGSAINGIPSFFDEVNRVFMADEDWKLGHSLDALDDMLYGGYGALAGHPGAILIWRDIEHTRRALGVDATRAWLREKLDGTGTFNTHAITAQMQALEAGEGQTYFQIVMDIFAAHPQLKLVRC